MNFRVTYCNLIFCSLQYVLVIVLNSILEMEMDDITSKSVLSHLYGYFQYDYVDNRILYFSF